MFSALVSLGVGIQDGIGSTMAGNRCIDCAGTDNVCYIAAGVTVSRGTALLVVGRHVGPIDVPH